MVNEISTLKWIEKWYSDQCNEDWEHQYGVKIDTLDNPGWDIIIDLKGTPLENKNIEIVDYEANENDWYNYYTDECKFKACGDPTKLEFLLNAFRRFVENC